MNPNTNETNNVQVTKHSYKRWGGAQYKAWDGEYDGAFEWATHGWARIEGSLSPWNEFFRLTINKDPVGDVEYLGDRSLVAFITSESSGIQSLYFSVYDYGFKSEEDSTNNYYKIDVTGKLTKWFYAYMGYSIKKRIAIIYLKFGDEEISHQLTSFQFVPRYFGLHIAKSTFSYPGLNGDI